MGVQSFQFSVDFLNNLEKPIIFIANKHKEILDSVSVYDNLSLTCNLNAFQTASFKIYRDVDGKKQDYFKLFEEEMLIMIPGISWYEIHVETNIEPTGISKSITGNSLECTLCNKRLVDFQVNSDDFEDDDYVITKFYNPTDPKKSLLNRVLNVSPVWTVGHVDQSLWDIQRTFDESDTDVYSFLTGTVSEAFNCLFTFDTFNQTVNAYDLNNYGNDTNIFVSMDNLAQNMTETIDENSIFTCYRITGGDDIQIAEVNPNGTNKIYNFEYYLPMMPNDLQTKIKQYNEKYQELKPKYEDIVKRLGDQIYVIQELNTKYPDSLTSKDWTLYGLSGLETYKKSFETQNELFCAQGMNKPASLNYNLYTQNLENLNAVTAEYNKRLSEINEATNVYQSIVSEMKSLQSELDMNVWFTEDEWKILDSYVIEQTYSNDNFGAVDNTTEAELFSMEKELYDKAWEDLSKKCRPQYQYSSTLSNILTIPEFKEFVQYFELGNFIRMETDYDTIVRLRIISFTVDYSNTQTIAVTFSDAIRVKEVYDDISSIQAQATSAAMSFKFNKDQYDSTVKQGNFVAEMRKYGLDVATVAIHNASNQNQTWDDTGFTFRKWNDESQQYDPEQIKIINNLIAISDDGFDKSTVTAIGKIPIDTNGNFAWGVNAEVLVSKLVMSENLWIENNSGTYKFDDNGFTASNGVNTVKIQPNNSEELFSIYKGNDKKFYISSDGDIIFKGGLEGATGTFSGLLKGGSIDIGNGTFTVDSSGNMNASSGQFAGLVSGGSININDKFMVDKDGNVEALSGKFKGDITGSTGAFNGSINAKKITISRDNKDGLGSVDIRSGFGSFEPSSGTGSFSDVTGDSPAVEMYCSKNGQFASTMLTNNAYVVMAQNIALNGDITCHGIDILNVKNFSDIIKSMNMDAKYESSSYGYGTNSLISFRQYYDSRSYHYNDKDYCATTAKYVHEYVKQKIPNTSNFATKSDLSGHNHTITPTKISPSSGSGTHNFMYNFSTYSGTNGFSYTYGYASGSLSDKRLKENIRPIEDISDKYMQLVPIQFNFHEDIGCVFKGTHFGFIAQDVEKIFDDDKLAIICREHQEDEIANNYLNGDDAYVLDKDELHALHVQMIQKHEREIESLQCKIKEFERKIS